MKAKQKVKKCDTCFSFKSIAKYGRVFGGNNISSTCQDCIDEHDKIKKMLQAEDKEINIPVESFKVIRSTERPVLKSMSIMDIDSIICKYFNLPFGALQQNTRKREIVEPRQLAMYFARVLLKQSYSSIGNNLAGRGHDTVISAMKNVNNLCDTNIVFRRHKEYLEKKINKFQKELNKN